MSNSIVQSVLLSKKHFKNNLQEAKRWLADNDFKFYKVDITPSLYRFRQAEPIDGAKYRMKKINDWLMLVMMMPVDKRKIKKVRKPNQKRTYEKYKFLRFEKSNLRTKKYTAILKDIETGKLKRVHFGGIRLDGEPYEQYNDSTGLCIYSDYDHNDKKRRALYYKRHGEKAIKYSSKWFSHNYLW